MNQYQVADKNHISVDHNLPEIVNMDSYMENPPQLSDVIIDNVLRCGHKMLVSGSTKAGKTYLLM